MKIPDFTKAKAAIKAFENALEEMFTEMLDDKVSEKLDDVFSHDELSQAVQEYIIEVETLLLRDSGSERLQAVYVRMNANDAETAKNAILKARATKGNK